MTVQRRDIKLSLRFSKEELNSVKKIAKRKHLPTATYIRAKCLEGEND